MNQKINQEIRKDSELVKLCGELSHEFEQNLPYFYEIFCKMILGGKFKFHRNSKLFLFSGF